MRKKIKLIFNQILNRKIRRRSKDLDKFIKYEELKLWISKIKLNKIKGKNIFILHNKYKSNKLLFHPKNNKTNKLIKQKKSIKQMKYKNK